MTVAIVIFALSRFCQISAESVVLAGVAISSMFTGATTLLQYFADEVELNAMVFWTFGDLGSTDWKEIIFMMIVVAVSGIYFVLHRWDFNALLSGTETATSLGIHVRRLIIVNMILCCFTASTIVSYIGLISCFTASTIVSYIGLISFIGLVAPHIVRMVVGNNHVYLIPGSMLAGAVLLLLGDLAARTLISPIILPIGAITSFLGAPLISPIILPIGAITSFLGAPLFLYLLFKGGSRSC